MSKRWLLCLAFVLPSFALAAKDRPFIDESRYQRDDIVEPEYWKEGTSQLPPFPADADLIEFQVDLPNVRFSHFIDGKHLAIGKDDVVRYTLVLRSKSGVDNVFFEGIRCDSAQYQVYAYGSRGTFKPVESPDWERIGQSDADLVHRELQRYYLCEPSRYKPRKPEEILRALRGQVNVHDTGFIPD